MTTIILRAPLRALAGGAAEHDVEGADVRAAIAALEERHPGVRGFIRDEQGTLRRHLALFLNGEPTTLEAHVAPEDQLMVLPAISGGSDAIELLVGTKKGLVVLRGERGGELAIAARAFPGRVVDYAIRDRRSGRYLAACNDMHHGPRIWVADDPTGEWTPTSGPTFPEDAATSVERVWVIEPGVNDGELWAGVAPAALFHSADNGDTWELVRALWDQPTRSEWNAGAGGLMVHTICPIPGKPNDLLVGISSAGIWRTADAGATWTMGNAGIVPRYLPPEMKPVHQFCIHHVERSGADPDRLFMQFHGGVYRSDDAGASWIAIMDDLPADFGFVTVADPRDRDRAWVIPLIADMDRVPPEGRLRVYETTDAGTTWQGHGDGLPQHDAHQVVLRQAFCHDRSSPLGLWFGATSGELFGSVDDGNTWRVAAANLPPVLSVRVA
jgi:molybdopterin converting factor small subunit